MREAKKTMRRVGEFLFIKFPEAPFSWVIGILLIGFVGGVFLVTSNLCLHRLLEAIVDIVLWDLILYAILLIVIKPPKKY